MSKPAPTTESAPAAAASDSRQQLPAQLAQNLPLVHRVLSADPSELANMTMNGCPRMTHTPTYEEFEQSLTNVSDEEGVEQNIVLTMKRAFRDSLCEQIRNEPTIQPAKNLLVELHNQLRGLIPSRNDLHGILKDDVVQDADSCNELIQLLARAAQALSMLESESRAESTLAWIGIYQARDAARDESPEHFLVTSLLYLLRKAEMCAKDKQDFYFSHLYAPQLLQMGPHIERSAFEARFGKFSDPPSAAATRQWLQTLPRTDGEAKVSSTVTRHNNIKKGWVQGILFRSQRAESMPVPEVFYLDQRTFQQIRMIVRMSVSGSALALHACQAAGQSTDVLATNLEPSSPLDLRRTALVHAMGQISQMEDYQNNISESVIALARHWNPRLDASHVESLRGRVTQVLDAKDPVINLLNQRMKECFTELVVSMEAGVPAELRSGASTQPAVSRKAGFLTRAGALFCSKGMAFFASDLALAAWNASRIIEVVILVYDKVLLEPAYNSA